MIGGRVGGEGGWISAIRHSMVVNRNGVGDGTSTLISIANDIENRRARQYLFKSSRLILRFKASTSVPNVRMLVVELKLWS